MDCRITDHSNIIVEVAFDHFVSWEEHGCHTASMFKRDIFAFHQLIIRHKVVSFLNTQHVVIKAGSYSLYAYTEWHAKYRFICQHRLFWIYAYELPVFFKAIEKYVQEHSK